MDRVRRSRAARHRVRSCVQVARPLRAKPSDAFDRRSLPRWNAVLATRNRPGPTTFHRYHRPFGWRLALDTFVRKLRHGAWLDENDERSLRGLADGVRRVHARGDILHEGVTPRFLTLVLEGWACTYRALENGQRQILSILLPGDLAEPFGILPDFADHSIGAVTQVTLAQIAPDLIRTTARASARIEQALWWDLLVAIAIEREHAVSLGRRTASERLGHLFCELHLRQTLVGLAEGTTCDLPLTQSELADLLGLSAVHVNRSLQDLRGRGLVSLRNRKLIIHDLDELQNLSFFDPDYLHTGGAISSPSPTWRGE